MPKMRGLPAAAGDPPNVQQLQGSQLPAGQQDVDVADQRGEVDPRQRREGGDQHLPLEVLTHRDLVCPLHLGLMQGALTELGAPVTPASLHPFAEPSACVARLAHAG